MIKKKLPPHLSSEFIFRILEEEDLDLTRIWRNELNVRKWFKYSKPLTQKEHYNWYCSYLKKNNDYVFVVDYMEEKVGQVSVYNIEEKTAEIGRFIASPSIRGKGVMKRIIADFILYIFDVFKMEKVFLEVYESNLVAINIYEALGFCINQRTGDTIIMVKCRDLKN